MAFAVFGAERRLDSLHRRPSPPTAPGRGPFDVPQRPKRCWRIVGRWRNGREFLVVLGTSEFDAVNRLEHALAPLSRFELRCVRRLWLERWSPGSPQEYPRWARVCPVSMNRLRGRLMRRLKRKRIVFDPSLHGTSSLSRKGLAS
jgi:hypothetical protein